MSDNIKIKDPDATLDFGFDWNNADEGEWLESGETITSYTLTVGTGLTNESDSESGGIVTVWLSGGDEGEWYEVACKITTSAGRTDERTMKIKVIER